MCYQIAIKLKRDKHIAHIKGKSIHIQFDQDPIKAFDHPSIPIISKRLDLAPENMFWGLIPHWVKDLDQALSLRKMTLNATVENLLEKASFKNCVKNQRCIIPVSGFYEWQSHGKNKIPYYINTSNTDLMFFAGLFDRWTSADTGDTIETFTIVTTQANDLMAEIHNSKKRMPLILPENQLEEWLYEKPSTEWLKKIAISVPSDYLQAQALIQNTSPTLFD